MYKLLMSCSKPCLFALGPGASVKALYPERWTRISIRTGTSKLPQSDEYCYVQLPSAI